MTRPMHMRPSLEADGWMLVSAEERHAADPETSFFGNESG
jgi:hypothetical protein